MKEIMVFVDNDCRSCDRVVGVMRSLRAEDKPIDVRVVHRRKNPELFGRYHVQIVPAVYVDGKLCFYGEVTHDQILRSLNES